MPGTYKKRPNLFVSANSVDTKLHSFQCPTRVGITAKVIIGLRVCTWVAHVCYLFPLTHVGLHCLMCQRCWLLTEEQEPNQQQSKLRIQVDQSRVVFGVADTSCSLQYGECFFQPTIDGTPCMLTDTYLLVVSRAVHALPCPYDCYGLCLLDALSRLARHLLYSSCPP